MKRSILFIFILALLMSFIGCKEIQDEDQTPADIEKVVTETVIDELEEKVPDNNIAEEKPQEVKKQDEPIDESKGEYITKCILSIDCKLALGNLPPELEDIIPEDGVILAPRQTEFKGGESVFDLLLRVTREEGIHMEHTSNPVLDSYYIEGIANLYEFDCGELSGWTYTVNGESIGYGSSKFILSDGDIVKWVYTCDQGRDILL